MTERGHTAGVPEGSLQLLAQSQASGSLIEDIQGECRLQAPVLWAS